MDRKTFKKWKDLYFHNYVENDFLNLTDASALVDLLSTEYNFSTLTNKKLYLIDTEFKNRYVLINNMVYRQAILINSKNGDIKLFSQIKDLVRQLDPELIKQEYYLTLGIYECIGTVEESLKSSYSKLYEESQCGLNIVYFDSSFKYYYIWYVLEHRVINETYFKGILRSYLNEFLSPEKKDETVGQVFLSKIGLDQGYPIKSKIDYNENNPINIVEFMDLINQPTFNKLNYLNTCKIISENLTKELTDLIYQYLKLHQTNYYLTGDNKLKFSDKYDYCFVESIGCKKVQEKLDKLKSGVNLTKSQLKKLESKVIIKPSELDMTYNDHYSVMNYLNDLYYPEKITVLRNLIQMLSFRLRRDLIVSIKDNVVKTTYKISDIVNVLNNSFKNNGEFCFVGKYDSVVVEITQSDYVHRSDISQFLKNEVESILKDKFNLEKINWIGNKFTKTVNGEYVLI